MDSSHLSQSLFIQRRCLLEYTFQSLIDLFLFKLRVIWRFANLWPRPGRGRECIRCWGLCRKRVGRLFRWWIDVLVPKSESQWKSRLAIWNCRNWRWLLGDRKPCRASSPKIRRDYPVVFVFVVYHSETALGIVVENDAADDLVGALNDADAQVTFFEKTEQIRVVVQLIQSFPDFFRLIVDQRLQFLYVIQFWLTFNTLTFRIIMLSSSNKLKSLVNY